RPWSTSIAWWPSTRRATRARNPTRSRECAPEALSGDIISAWTGRGRTRRGEDRGTAMKIFLDTASLKEIREAAALGVLDGVTTNPSLLARESGDPEEILLEICRTVDGPISAEVVATDAEGMVGEGRHWAG